MKKPWGVAACLLLVGSAHAADVLATLGDATAFQRAERDVAALNSSAELDALTDVTATCSAVSLGQRQQHFECERAVKRYWTRYNRGRSLDTYIAAVGSLFEGFDNAGANPTDAMATAYRHAAVNMIALLRDINARYRQLDKR